MKEVPSQSNFSPLRASPRARAQRGKIALARYFAILAAAWVASGFAALAWLRQREPRRDEPVPAELVGIAEELRLATRDGETLGAWFLAATRGDAPSVIELHGNGGGRRARLGAAEVLRERGCAVLLVTLRAHGDSTGGRKSFGWDERHDVVAAVDWLERRRPGRPILVHGASLGAAAAVLAAEELGERVDGYALECLYADLDLAARNRCAVRLPPILDLAAYGALRAAAVLAWPDWKRDRPIDALASISPRAPVLLLAGADDREAPVEEQRALFERVRGHAELVVLDGAPHDRLQHARPEEYRRAVLGWLDQCARYFQAAQRIQVRVVDALGALDGIGRTTVEQHGARIVAELEACSGSCAVAVPASIGAG